ncbi:hypothetical protein MNEG_14359 [Monoraphidium neglectum]|uniref:Uncharacterized protein n=1 Tax=Monoraphidium neglectum TaxID=145388 RepID=A0A0D2LPD0_9CHLO|nr:hypothetical protein MNEG_14359 [Monoraphidium neglectum]KIY93604.1 hypothetical protein MNEG_14359 [Monoraphidium neglectum]|eukprot:XP_013892624.1 hypothetical protein MNEG_14359 [Monoraphidium neglectum]
MATTQTRNTQLGVRIEGLGAQLDGLRGALAGREAELSEARAALVEKDGGLRRWEAQVRELEARLVAAAGERQALEERLSAEQAASAAASRAAGDAEQRLAAKKRGFALLRADFAAQRVEVEEVARANGKLLARVADLQRELAAASQISAKASAWRSASEAAQMRVEDLEADLSRQAERRGDLVAAYWPVMARLRAAERAARALEAQLRGAGLEPAAALPHALPGEDAAAAALEAAASGLGEAASGAGARGGPAAVAADQPRAKGHESAAEGSAVGASCAGEGVNPVSDSLQQQQQQQQQEESSSESSSGGGGDVSGQGEEGGASSLEEQLSAARQEHERLARAWLLLQDEYWRQKERGMALEIEAGQLRGSWRAAEEKLEKAVEEAAAARAAAGESDALRRKLECDLVGVKAWLRSMEGAGQAHLAALRELGAHQEARAAAEGALRDARQRAASASAAAALAAAEAASLAAERGELLRRGEQERRRAARAEQTRSQ